MCVINDLLGQTNSPACSDHYSHWKVVLRDFEKQGRMDTTCENSDLYRPRLWIVDPRGSRSLFITEFYEYSEIITMK